MKKSKVIIPAMAVIAFSTAASITGTVAWFTASRSAVITQANMAVVRIDGTLSALYGAGIGTRILEDEQHNQTGIAPKQYTVTADPLVKADVMMTNSSFNPVTKQLYYREGTDANPTWHDIGNTTSYKDADSSTAPYRYSELSDMYYYAFTWKVTFSYAFGEDHRDLNIFFDPNESSMTPENGTGASTHTSDGFRVAMIGQSTDGRTVVYSGTQDKANMSGIVKSGAGTQESPYAYTATTYGATGTQFESGFGYFDQDDTKVRVPDFADNQKTESNFVASIAYNATPANCKVDVYFVAWYEGTDPAVINASTLDQVASTLSFYSAINKN